MSNAPTLEKQPLSGVQWLVCVIAAIGFAFDIYELLMLPLIIRPAMLELAGIQPGTEEFKHWLGLLFYVPAFAGGLFGLLGGYLTDRLGRRRVLTWSILLYAFSAFAAGFSTNLGMLLFFRTTTFIGVCVEFVAAVAWLAELFDDPEQREKVLGYTQAFSSVGGLMVAIANGIAIQYAARFVAIPNLGNVFGPAGTSFDAHAPWRYTLMSGLIPAIPLILIRPFLPESPKWAMRKAAGTLRRPSIAELFSPALRRTTIVTTIMFAASFGVAFGAIQQIPQIVPGIDAVRNKVAELQAHVDEPDPARRKEALKHIQGLTPRERDPEFVKDPEKKKILLRKIKGLIEQEKAADYTKSQELGGLLGRFTLAAVVLYFASRRALLRAFLIPGLFLMPLIFYGFAVGEEQTYFSMDLSWVPGFHDVHISLLGLGILVAGFFTVAQFSFWGNYLPHVYPVHLRGTGESFAANIGGRMIGTSFAYVTVLLADAPFIPGKIPATKFAYAALIVATALYAVNLVMSFYLPEPREDIDHA